MMGIIFPLSGVGRIVLVCIAFVLGIILYRLWKAFPTNKPKEKEKGE